MPKLHICIGKNVLIEKNPDREIEEKMLEIRKEHKDYGYRKGFHGELVIKDIP